MKRQDVIETVNSLMKEDKLRGISVILVQDGCQTIYRKEIAEYKCTCHDSYLEVTSTGGNFVSKKFIPYENILYVEGVIDK